LYNQCIDLEFDFGLGFEILFHMHTLGWFIGLLYYLIRECVM